MDTKKNASNDLRRVLHSAYTLVRSLEMNKAVGTLTLDHLIGEHITALKPRSNRAMLDGRGESLGNRVSRWDQLNKLETDVQLIVDAVKQAGEDTEKLKQLGIYEVDGTTDVAEAQED